MKVPNGHTYFFSRRPDDLLNHVYPRKLAKNSALPYKFAFARTALKYGLTTMALNRGDILLVPDLICESLLEPIETLGVEICYYPVDRTLIPVWEELSRLVSGASKALLVVHYFGQPQPIEECLSFCSKHSLMLIEDNAHGFGGNIDRKLLGTFGEIGISSPRKTFPIRNGAFLYLAGHLKLDLTPLQLQPTSEAQFIQLCKQFLKNLPLVRVILNRRKANFALKRRLETPPPYGSQDAFRDPPVRHDYGMDQYIEEFLAQQDIARIRDKRQEIYYLWRQFSEKQGLAPVFPRLAPGALPLVFPAYTQSPRESRKWHEQGHRAGVDIHSWPTLPRAVVELNGNAMRLWERMICFPIHQDMNVQLLKNRLTHI